MQDLWTISFFLIFSHEVRHYKVRKVKDPGFWKKSSDGLGGLKKSPKWGFYGCKKILSTYICFFASIWKCQWSFNFLQKQHVWKNLVLELWSKKLQANQNAGFFKLEYLTNKLRYEVEFLDVIKAPRRQQILVCCFKWVSPDMLWHGQMITNSESGLCQEWVELWSYFFFSF